MSNTRIFSNIRVLCLTFALLAVCWPFSVVAQPTMIVTNDSGTTILGSTTIGDTLHVALSNATPWEIYRIELMGPTGTIVAKTAGRANSAGELHALDLFIDSGVTPCLPPGLDPIIPETPDGYAFENLAEANQTLDGQALTVVAVEQSTETWIAIQTLVFSAGDEPYFYFSDRAACKRTRFNMQEDVYLSIVNGLPGIEYRVFIIEEPMSEEEWQVGYAFTDARYTEQCSDPDAETCPSYPEGSTLYGPPATQAVSTHFLPGSFPDLSSLVAVVRGASEVTSTERLLCDQATQRSTDYFHSNSPYEGGSSSESWSCPPCPPNNN